MYSPEFQAGSTKITGQAFTVKFVPKSDVDAPGIKGNYVQWCFILQPPPNVNAVHGGLMLVIDGRLRDLKEHQDPGFPVISLTLTRRGGCRPLQINVPIQVIQQAVTPVNPGDFITADIDGMACCPRELVQRVLEVIPTIFAADRKFMEAIKAGMSIEDAFAKFRGCHGGELEGDPQGD
ncbi:hypothetical protein B0O99DRAFT_656990 [Bisporella sp. PMI_857]|nr:hypothetical protein B0O99DRAFT_656990 [Bisporella sp. PMI_857]